MAGGPGVDGGRPNGDALKTAPLSAVPDPRFPVPMRTRFHRVAVLEGHTGSIACLQFSPDGGQLVSASADRTLRLWAVPADSTTSGVGVLRGHTAGISDAAWDPSGSGVLASASDDRTVRLWHAPTQRHLATLVGHTHHVFCVAFSATGGLVASGSVDETVRVWSVRDALAAGPSPPPGAVVVVPLRVLPAHSDPVTGLAFLGESTALASCSYDGLVRLWSAEDGKCLHTLLASDSPPVGSLSAGPGGTLIAAAQSGTGGTAAVRLWRLTSRDRNNAFSPLRTYTGHVNGAYAVPARVITAPGLPLYTLGGGAGNEPHAGKYVVAGSEDGRVYVWELQSTKLAQVLPGRAPPDPTAAATTAAAAATTLEGNDVTGDGAAAAPSLAGGEDDPGGGHTSVVIALAAHPGRPLLATGAMAPDHRILLWLHE